MCAQNYEKLLRVDRVITTNTVYGFFGPPCIYRHLQGISDQQRFTMRSGVLNGNDTGGAAQVAAAHCPNERTLDPAVNYSETNLIDDQELQSLFATFDRPHSNSTIVRASNDKLVFVYHHCVDLNIQVTITTGSVCITIKYTE